tara:strand:- start:123 stop:281 length:159 start_codon:yes stop_codon:yes gene_type:complete
MLYCKDNKGDFRKIAYGTPDQNLAFIADANMARRMLARLGVVTHGAVLVRIK